MENYLGEVLPYIPKCPEVVVEKAILEAAISLCNNTNCWRKEQTSTVSAIPEFSTEETYTVGDYVTYLGLEYELIQGGLETPPLPTDTDYWEVKTDTVYLDTALSFDTGAELVTIPELKRDGRWYNDYKFSASAISVPSWPSDSEIKITIAQRPLRDATALPAGFKAMTWTSWIPAMAAMAKSSLYAMAGQPWHNPQASAYELTKYTRECGKIRAEILKENPMKEMRVQARPFV